MIFLGHLFSIVVVVALAVFITVSSGNTGTYSIQEPSSLTASSTLSVPPDFFLPEIDLSNLVINEDNSLSTEKNGQVSSTSGTEILATEDVVAPKTVVKPIESQLGTRASLDTATHVLRDALVNILCYAPLGGPLHSISGSGVIIDPKGIILTNAHIAQYFLLTDTGVSCTIRAGSPAIDRYYAEIIYLPSAWIHNNPSTLTKTLPSGTGEYDFAFLAITRSASMLPLPSIYPFIPLATTPPKEGEGVVIGSYGAQFLSTNQVQRYLSPTLVYGSVKKVYTFVDNTIDVFDLGGSAAAQEGSSGGGVANSLGELTGTITTSTVEGTTDTRSLNAITASYIRAAYASATGSAIDLLFAQPAVVSVAHFAPQIPALAEILIKSL